MTLITSLIFYWIFCLNVFSVTTARYDDARSTGFILYVLADFGCKELFGVFSGVVFQTPTEIRTGKPGYTLCMLSST